jgi:hypothetical protein
MVSINDRKIKALDAIDKAIDRINEHFNGDADPVISSIAIDHLKRLQKQLYYMKNIIESNNMKQGESLIGIGKVIVDSWPYDSVIGNLIVKADQEFKSYIRIK